MSARAARLCLDCGDFTDGADRCPACKRQQQRKRDAARGTTTQRGYGAGHRTDRAAKIPAAIGTACPLCGEEMTQEQADAGQLHRHHEVPVAHGGRDTSQGVITHGSCDRREGGRTRRRR